MHPLHSHSCHQLHEALLLSKAWRNCGTALHVHIPCISQHSMLSVHHLAAGFTFNFARTGIWGSGTYYSCELPLATSYQHQMQITDPAFSTYLAGVEHTKGGQGMQAVARAVTCLLEASYHNPVFYVMVHLPLPPPSFLSGQREAWVKHEL